MNTTSEITSELASNNGNNALSRMRKRGNNPTREAFELRNQLMEYFFIRGRQCSLAGKGQWRNLCNPRQIWSVVARHRQTDFFFMDVLPCFKCSLRTCWQKIFQQHYRPSHTYYPFEDFLRYLPNSCPSSLHLCILPKSRHTGTDISLLVLSTSPLLCSGQSDVA